jgi:hypothetical protein
VQETRRPAFSKLFRTFAFVTTDLRRRDTVQSDIRNGFYGWRVYIAALPAQLLDRQMETILEEVGRNIILLWPTVHLTYQSTAQNRRFRNSYSKRCLTLHEKRLFNLTRRGSGFQLRFMRNASLSKKGYCAKGRSQRRKNCVAWSVVVEP